MYVEMTLHVLILFKYSISELFTIPLLHVRLITFVGLFVCVCVCVCACVCVYLQNTFNFSNDTPKYYD